jgi:hypothetical protein
MQRTGPNVDCGFRQRKVLAALFVMFLAAKPATAAVTTEQCSANELDTLAIKAYGKGLSLNDATTPFYKVCLQTTLRSAVAFLIRERRCSLYRCSLAHLILNLGMLYHSRLLASFDVAILL